MDRFDEMVEAVQDDLTLSDSSNLYPPALIKRAINRAKRKVEGLFRWPKLEDSQKTTVPSGAAQTEYFNYPQNWRPDSIWKLKVNTYDYGDPLSFKDYLYEQENDNPSGQTRMWANQWTRYFIDPALSAGDVINIWGIKVTDALVADGDTTIFSYSMPEVNEAIVLEAAKILKSKGEEQQSGEMLSAEAKATVALAWSRIKQDSAREEKTQPMLDVPDMFPSNTRRGRKDSNIGNF